MRSIFGPAGCQEISVVDRISGMVPPKAGSLQVSRDQSAEFHMRKEDDIFDGYLRAKNLKASYPRRKIAEVFLRLERHVTVSELYEAVRRHVPRAGLATVYRTLKLLCDCGLARELRFDDGMSRYEHLYGHAHHDHLICTRCGRVLEVADEGIEALQERLFKKYDFAPERHRMELYGVCAACRRGPLRRGGLGSPGKK